MKTSQTTSKAVKNAIKEKRFKPKSRLFEEFGFAENTFKKERARKWVFLSFSTEHKPAYLAGEFGEIPVLSDVLFFKEYSTPKNQKKGS